MAAKIVYLSPLPLTAELTSVDFGVFAFSVCALLVASESVVSSFVYFSCLMA